MDIERVFKNSRLTKALTGLKEEEFKVLSEAFEKCLYKDRKRQKCKRKIGGGRKGILKDGGKKLFFILFYLKVYPTYDLAGFIFGADKSRPCRWVAKLLPILEQALGYACVLPKRRIKSVKEFLEAFPEVKDLFVD